MHIVGAESPEGCHGWAEWQEQRCSPFAVHMARCKFGGRTVPVSLRFEEVKREPFAMALNRDAYMVFLLFSFYWSRDIVRLQLSSTAYALPEVSFCRWDFWGCEMPSRSTARCTRFTWTTDGHDAVYRGSDPGGSTAAIAVPTAKPDLSFPTTQSRLRPHRRPPRPRPKLVLLAPSRSPRGKLSPGSRYSWINDRSAREKSTVSGAIRR